MYQTAILEYDNNSLPKTSTNYDNSGQNFNQSLKTFNPTNLDVNNIENTKDYLSLVDIYSSDLDYRKTLLFSPWVKKF